MARSSKPLNGWFDVALLSRLMQLFGLPILGGMFIIATQWVLAELKELNTKVNTLTVLVEANRGTNATQLESVRQIQIDRGRRIDQIELRLDRIEQDVYRSRKK